MCDAEMPRYQCHKEVHALKIGAIEFLDDGAAKIHPYDKSFAAFQTKPKFAERFGGFEGDLGYYVVYADGYVSWSPTKAFEEGYRAIRDRPINPRIERNFNLYPPTELRGRLKELAYLIDERIPEGREQSLTQTKLEEVAMWAHAGIAR